MEPEETGLTVAEKVMFYILGLAILIVGGILIFGNIKDRKQNLQEETKETESLNEKEVKNETASDDSKSLPEENNSNTDIKNGETSASENETNSSSQEPSDDKSDTTKSKEEISTNSEEESSTTVPNSTQTDRSDNTPNTRVPDTRVDDYSANNAWKIPDSIVLEAFSGDTITVDKTVINSNGKKETAQVTVRYLEGNSYNIISTPNNRFVAKKGVYKYYYTHNSVTKIATLHVEERATNVSFSTLKDFSYIENDEFTKYEFTSIIDNSKNTTITKNNNIHTINIEKNNSENYTALLINTGEKIESIRSNTKGIYVGSDYSSLWNEDYEKGTARVIINLKYIKSNEVIKLKLNINGETKVVEIKVIVNNKQEKREKLESDTNNRLNNKIETDSKADFEEQDRNIPNENTTYKNSVSNESEVKVEEDNDLNHSLDRT